MRKINRYICIIAVIMLTFLCAACGKKDSSGEVITAGAYSNKNGFLNFSSDVAETENGYYVVAGNTNGNYIGYIDKQTGKSTVLCSKINCTHTFSQVPDDCDAYVGNVLLGTLNYYNGYIYYIAYEEGTYKCSLNRITIDGSEHEKIFDMGKAPDISNAYFSYIVTEPYIIYAVSADVGDEQNKAELVVYSVKNKTKETIYNYEAQKAEIFDIKMNNNTIYFRQSANGQRTDSELCGYNLSNKKAARIADNVCSYTLKGGSNLAYWKAFDGIYELTIETGDIQKLYTAGEDTMLGFIAANDTDYYIYNISNKSYKQGESVYVGMLNKTGVTTKLYVDGDDYLLPLYIGSDRIITNVLSQSGKFYGYAVIENGRISDNVIKTDITGN